MNPIKPTHTKIRPMIEQTLTGQHIIFLKEAASLPAQQQRAEPTMIAGSETVMYCESE